jgi:hypothetical protein
MAKKIFVHILLFECPQCGAPIDSVLSTEDGNPEEIDDREIQLRCRCNWAGKSHGFAAKRRLIVDWEPKDAPSAQSVDCNHAVLGMLSKERFFHAVRPEN